MLKLESQDSYRPPKLKIRVQKFMIKIDKLIHIKSLVINVYMILMSLLVENLTLNPKIYTVV